MRLHHMLLPLVTLLSLPGCGIVSSTKPLFEPGTLRLREGLWASIGKNCAMPGGPRIATWPDCASPFLVKGNTIADPRHPDQFSRTVISDGDPTIIQFEAQMKPRTMGYLYAVASLSSKRPITEMSLAPLYCPKDKIADLKSWKRAPDENGDRNCEAFTPEAVRTVADLPRQADMVPLVWIADAPVLDGK